MPDGGLQGALMAGYGLESDWLATLPPAVATDYHNRLKVGVAMAAVAGSPKCRALGAVTVLAVNMLWGHSVLVDGTGQHYEHAVLDCGIVMWKLSRKAATVRADNDMNWRLTQQGKEACATWAAEMTLAAI